MSRNLNAVNQNFLFEFRVIILGWMQFRANEIYVKCRFGSVRGEVTNDDSVK